MTNEEIRDVVQVIKRMIPDISDRMRFMYEAMYCMYKWQEDCDLDHVTPAVMFQKDLRRVLEKNYDRH